MLIGAVIVMLALAPACGGKRTTDAELRASGSDRDEESTGRTTPRTILLGETLELEAFRRYEHPVVVSSDNPRVDYEKIQRIILTCKSDTGAPCKVTHTTIEPGGAGVFHIAANIDGEHREWDVTVVDPKRVEVEPCGTTSATGLEHSYIPARVVAVGSDGTRVPLKARVSVDHVVATFVSTDKPGHHTVSASALGRDVTCSFDVIEQTP